MSFKLGGFFMSKKHTPSIINLVEGFLLFTTLGTTTMFHNELNQPTEELNYRNRQAEEISKSLGELSLLLL